MNRRLKLLLIFACSIASLSAGESTSFSYSQSGSNENSSYSIKTSGSSYSYDSTKPAVEQKLIFTYKSGSNYSEVETRNPKIFACVNELLNHKSKASIEAALHELCDMHLATLSTRPDAPMYAANILFYISISSDVEHAKDFSITIVGEDNKTNITRDLAGVMTHGVLLDQLMKLSDNSNVVRHQYGFREMLDVYCLELEGESNPLAQFRKGYPMTYVSNIFLDNITFKLNTGSKLTDLIGWFDLQDLEEKGSASKILFSMQILKALCDRGWNPFEAVESRNKSQL